MLTIIKTWISTKLIYIKICIAVLIISAIGFLYIQNISYKKDIEKAKVEIEQKELVIKNQQVAIQTQQNTINLANSMSAVRDETLKQFSSRVDAKIKPINDIIAQIKNGHYDKPQCVPSQSIKEVINAVQNGSKQ